MLSASDSTVQRPVYVTIKTGNREVKYEVPATYHEILPKVQECMPALTIEAQVHIAAALALNKTRKNKPIDKDECESVLKLINGTKITAEKFKEKAIALAVFAKVEDFKTALVGITEIIEHAPGMANLYLLRAYFASLSNHPLIDALVQSDLEQSRLLNESGIDFQNDFEESYHFVRRESFFIKGDYANAKDSHALALKHARDEDSKQKLKRSFLAVIDLKIDTLTLSDPDQVYELLKLRVGVTHNPAEVQLIVQLGKELNAISPQISAEEVKKAKLNLFQHLKIDKPQAAHSLGAIVNDNLTTLCRVRLNRTLTAALSTSPAISASQDAKETDVPSKLRSFYPAFTENQIKDLSAHLAKWSAPDNTPAKVEKSVCDEVLRVVNGDMMTDEVFEKCIEDLYALKAQFQIRKAIELSSQMISKYPGSSLGYLERANYRQGLNAAKHRDAIYRDLQIAGYIQEHLEFHTRNKLELNFLLRQFYLDNFKLVEANFYHAEVLGMMDDDDKAYDKEDSRFDAIMVNAIWALKESSPAKAYRLFTLRTEISQNQRDQVKAKKIENLFDPLEVTSPDLLAECKGYALFKFPGFFTMDPQALKSFVNTPALRREIMDVVMAAGYKTSHPLTAKEAMVQLESQSSINSDVIYEMLTRVPHVKGKQLTKECHRLKEILDNLLARVAKARAVTKADTNDVMALYARIVRIEKDIEIDLQNTALKAAEEAGLDPFAFLDEEEVVKSKPSAKAGKSKSTKRAPTPKQGTASKATSPTPVVAPVTARTQTTLPITKQHSAVTATSSTNALKLPSHLSSITAFAESNDEKVGNVSPVNFAWPSTDLDFHDEKKSDHSPSGSASVTPQTVPPAAPKANLRPFLKWLSTNPVPAPVTQPKSVTSLSAPIEPTAELAPVQSETSSAAVITPAALENLALMPCTPTPQAEVVPLELSTTQSAPLLSTDIKPEDLQSAPCTPELTVQAASIGHIMELVSLQAEREDASIPPPETILNLSLAQESDAELNPVTNNDEKQDITGNVLPDAFQSGNPAFAQAGYPQFTPDYVYHLYMQNLYLQYVTQEYARWQSVVATSLAANGCVLFPPNIPTPVDFMNTMLFQSQLMQVQANQLTMPVPPPPVVNPEPEQQQSVTAPAEEQYVSHIAPDNQRALYHRAGRHNHRHFHHGQNRDGAPRDTTTHPYHRPAQPQRK